MLGEICEICGNPCDPEEIKKCPICKKHICFFCQEAEDSEHRCYLCYSDKSFQK